MHTQPALHVHRVAVEALAPDHVRAGVRSPGLADRAHGAGPLPEQRAGAAPVRVLLLVSAARRVGGAVLLERARLPPIDQIRAVRLAAVGRDVELSEEPAAVVAEAVARRLHPRVVARTAPRDRRLAVLVEHEVAVRV